MVTIEAAFVLAEANARLSNASPEGDVHYESIKNRIIKREITVAEARQLILDFHTTKLNE